MGSWSWSRMASSAWASKFRPQISTPRAGPCRSMVWMVREATSIGPFSLELDIRASRHSGPVRREPDGPRAAEFDAGKAGSGGDGGVNHLGLHRNASGHFRPLRGHASAGAIFQKARTIDHAGGGKPPPSPGGGPGPRPGPFGPP